MLGTVWLILVALAFGGIIERAGVLERLIGPVIAAARSVGALVATLVGAAFATNVLASDQYIAVVLPGRMFRPAFDARGLAPVVLSRTLGDSAHRHLAARFPGTAAAPTWPRPSASRPPPTSPSPSST